MKITAEHKAIAKSWAKVFAAAVIAAYSAGSREWTVLVNAGVAALIPVVYSWLDPKDSRYGRRIVVKKKAIKVVRKKAK
jgi:membrane protein YdbS with pleckstrin-like domain